MDWTAAVSEHEAGTLLDVWVVAGASSTEVSGLHDGAVRVRVEAPPEAGRANRAVAELLSGMLGAPVELVAGAGGRRKRFLVIGTHPAEAVARLASGAEGG